MPKETIKYPKGTLTVIWKPGICIHSRICWKKLPVVFNPTLRPWINMDGATAESIKAQVLQCPSGALSFEEELKQVPDSKADESAINQPSAPILPTLVECRPNGPLIAHGNFTVKNSDGTETLREGIVAFCRCGGSGNKPFCDGTHRKNGFIG